MTRSFPGFASSRVLLLVLLSACGPKVTLRDDLAPCGEAPTGDPAVLHGPYVQGATVRLTAQSDSQNQSLEGWSFASSNASVLQIEAITLGEASAFADAVALSAGTTTITLLDPQG